MILSLPTWERGLKLGYVLVHNHHQVVAPHVGAWIETHVLPRSAGVRFVAPHVGAWIET